LGLVQERGTSWRGYGRIALGGGGGNGLEETKEEALKKPRSYPPLKEGESGALQKVSWNHVPHLLTLY